jgi:hypothetical protein
VRLARYQGKIDQPPGGVADTNDLAAEAAFRTARNLATLD